MEISVLIPAYNREDTICRAIKSVTNQTFTDFELIIVDDGSQDGTIEAVSTIPDPRIKVIRHPKNLGEAEARNTAVKSASGRYIAFLDLDDEWLPEKLSRQMQVIQSKPEGIIANVSGYFLYDEYNVQRREIPPKPGSWYKFLLMGLGPGPTNLVVSKEAFDKIGYFDPSLPRYTDWDWLLRFTRLYPLTVTPEPLSVIYRAPLPQAKVVEQAARQFLQKHTRDFQQFGYYGRIAKGKRYLEVSIYYYLEGKKADGWKWLSKALIQSPFQRPGMYLRILDALLGISLVPAILRILHPYRTVK